MMHEVCRRLWSPEGTEAGPGGLPFETSPPDPLSIGDGEGETLRKVLLSSFPLSSLLERGPGGEVSKGMPLICRHSRTAHEPLPSRQFFGLVIPPPPAGTPSSTSLTFSRKTPGGKGFCKKCCSGSSTPWSAIESSG